ncbi:AAA domain-containing protein [Saccharothrix carnea]|uniref:AAA domain-containing protein n=1 Tax=Saccharothrix carnea TaxID=1280637 RepID=A0A2P8ICX3_SACCR|nr:ATP-binding protein [Saccharothrix carnea]PSL56314.1 AAA domain-containing protein [Saccharothrix carnea]
MYISQVRLRNVKGFHGAREVDLKLTAPGWTVIAGRNGSGKTSLLRAIALAVSGPAVARNLVPDFENWVTAGQREGVVQVQFTHDRRVEKFGKGRPPEGRLWAGLGWTMPDEESRPTHRGLQPSLKEKLEGSKTAALRGPWQDNPTGWFCAAYGPFRRLVGGAGDAQRLMLSHGPVSRLASLFHEDASLAEGVGWLIEQHLRSLERRPGAEELKTVALGVLSDGLLPDDYRIEGVDSDGLWVVSGGHRFPLREMSDGYRTVAALVVDLIKQIHESYGDLKTTPTAHGLALTAPGVVIIDEVDAHLHVSWQKRIGGWLKEHFPNIQFIVTTHSPYLCQAADPGGLIRLPGPDQQEPPRVVDRELYERIVYGSGDDAVLSELFGLDTPYSERAQELRAELVDLEVAVIGGTADARAVRRYEALRALLTSSPVARTREVAARLERDGT